VAAYPTKYRDTGGNVSTTGFSTDTWSGVIYQRSSLGNGNVKDGTSRTYLIGEKFVDSKHTEDGLYYGDQASLYAGMGPDNYRNTSVFPAAYTNTNGVDSTDPGSAAQAGTTTVPNAAMVNDSVDTNGTYGCMFGSAHSGVVNFVFCDGATKSITVGIDPLTHRYLGERNDGKILDDAMIGQ
jgi:prepilin-type processing-associated H-X9-DG protein